MFDIGWSEMAIVVLIALIVIGPKDLPRVARNIGKWTAKGRAMARDFQRSLEEMGRETGLDEVKKEVEKVSRMDLGSQIEKNIDPGGDLKKAFDPTEIGKEASTTTAAKATNGAGADAKAENDKAEPESETAAPAAADEPAETPRPTPAAQS